MNGSLILALVGLTLTCAASACSLPPPNIDPRSIATAARFGPISSPRPAGQLRVNTEKKEEVVGDDVPHWVHEGYDIFDHDGKFVRHVDNHFLNTDEGLMTVSLASGQYFVAIPEGRRPRTWVEVTIADGRLTEADVTEILRH